MVGWALTKGFYNWDIGKGGSISESTAVYTIKNSSGVVQLTAGQGLSLRVMGVRDSQSLLVASDIFTSELSDAFLMEICRAKLCGSSLTALRDFDECQVFSNSEAASKVIDIASVLGKLTGLVLVDCTASSETIGLLNQAAELGCCVVLANKKPLASETRDYEKLLSRLRHIRYESTVSSFVPQVLVLLCWPSCDMLSDLDMLSDISFISMAKVGAGLPVICSLTRILSSGDNIHRIVGSLSGTLGYVMSELEDGKPFSQVVQAAKSLGYTEPDPRDDLGGMDVARKALIVSRLLGAQMNLDDIKVDSLYPDKMGPDKMTVQDFLENGLPSLDKDIEARVQTASSNGNVLRYVCMIEGLRCTVGLKELPKHSALGRLRGSDNVVEVYSRCYPEQPLVIQGAGAGNDTTAAGVLADIVDLQDLFS
ncbi:hypothetical protein ACLOJK_024984 [Asimina triloba]